MEPANRKAALQLAREIAELADVPIAQVLGYFSFEGRLPAEIQTRIVAADAAVLGSRSRRTRRRVVNLMNFADFWIENEFEQGQPVTTIAA